MVKFGFKIKTRGGMVVDNLMVTARDRDEAERKVNQIYQRCEILECQEMQQSIKEENLNLENVISLIGKESDSGTPDKS